MCCSCCSKCCNHLVVNRNSWWYHALIDILKLSKKKIEGKGKWLVEAFSHGTFKNLYIYFLMIFGFHGVVLFNVLNWDLDLMDVLMMQNHIHHFCYYLSEKYFWILGHNREQYIIKWKINCICYSSQKVYITFLLSVDARDWTPDLNPSLGWRCQ